jgi:membrane protein DedA with SNARE-associated domain
MNYSNKMQFIRDKILSRKLFQIVVFVFILAFSVFLFVIARRYLNMENFLTYGYLGVFLTNLICCASILFPVPGEAINIAAGAIMNPLMVALVATIGATIGELTSYLAGYVGRKITLTGYWEKYESAERWMKRYGSFSIFLFALLPILVFDLIGIIAGSTRYPLWKFILACFIGRFIRCVAESYLGFGFLSSLPSLW